MVGAVYSVRTGPVKRFAHFTQDGGIFLSRCLFLAGRTEERRTARLRYTLDQMFCPTVRAWSPFASVDEVQILKPAFRAVSLHIVAQRRPSGRDGLLQDLRNGFRKSGGLFSCQGTGLPLGMNATAEQRLAHIDIAKTCNQLLIQQRGFDRCTPALEQVCQCRTGHGVRKRLHSQMRKQAVTVLFRRPNQIDHAKASGINQPCPRAAVRFKNQMLVCRRSRVCSRLANRESA